MELTVSLVKGHIGDLSNISAESEFDGADTCDIVVGKTALSYMDYDLSI
jgi:hypothetical protein